jgi:hypothetical protein
MEDIAEVKEMIVKYHEALMQRDVLVLERIWSDDYLLTNADGSLFSKEQRLADIKSGATGFESISWNENEIKLRVYEDMVVANIPITLKGQYSEMKVSGQFHSLHVWVRRGGRWQLVAHQIMRTAPS